MLKLALWLSSAYSTLFIVRLYVKLLLFFVLQLDFVVVLAIVATSEQIFFAVHILVCFANTCYIQL